MHRYYADRPYLDLYMNAGAHWGREISINGRFAAHGAWLGDWELSGRHRFSSFQGGSRIVHLADANPASRATMSVPAVGERLYIFGFDARAEIPSSRLHAVMVCASVAGSLEIAPDGVDAAVPSDGQWHRLSIATICPQSAVRVSVEVRNVSAGELAIRDVTLREVAPAGGPTP